MADDFPIAVIGAGLSGIGAGIRLKQAGFSSFVIFERGDSVGGTWRDNRYPGAACDVPAHLYSYSFAQNPDWSHVYAGAPEIWNYTRDLVQRHGLEPHLRLNTSVISATFHESSGHWHLRTSDGQTTVARAVLAGVGGLVDPRRPDIDGLDTYEGDMFHTARWDHDCSLAGRRVAVIGTGASAVQVIPAIADGVGQLSVFQRTASWVVPKHDHAYSRGRRWLHRSVPPLLWLSRARHYWTTEVQGPVVYLNSRALSAVGRRRSLQHLRAQVADEDLRRRLTPDYQFGCKRVLISSDYWSTLERSHVNLVTDPIASVEPKGIRTRDGTLHEADVIVLATGFDVSMQSAPFPIQGRFADLREAWRPGASSYLGMMVHGFPNWYFLMGPNTGPGHTSVLVYTEAQLGFALQAIRRIHSKDLRWLDVRESVQAEYNRRLQARMPHMAWSSGCSSWYLSEDGVNRSLYPGPAFEYAWRARTLRPSDFEEAAR